MKEILAIIPARGGSKSIKRKNIKPLLGKPMVAYSIEACQKSKYITRVVVSTEDAEIKESKDDKVTPNKTTIISKVNIDFFGNITEV